MASGIRVTSATLKILEALVQTGPDEEMFGLRICRQTDLGSGTVYPVLDRLERAGWIVGEWEGQQPGGRPKRRRYVMTKAGEAAYALILARQQDKARRWRPALRPGTEGAGA